MTKLIGLMLMILGIVYYLASIKKMPSIKPNRNFFELLTDLLTGVWKKFGKQIKAFGIFIVLSPYHFWKWIFSGKIDEKLKGYNFLTIPCSIISYMIIALIIFGWWRWRIFSKTKSRSWVSSIGSWSFIYFLQLI